MTDSAHADLVARLAGDADYVEGIEHRNMKAVGANIREAIAALSTPPSDTGAGEWVRVPREPTEVMVEAGGYVLDHFDGSNANARRIYEAMLNNVDPSPPGAEGATALAQAHALREVATVYDELRLVRAAKDDEVSQLMVSAYREFAQDLRNRADIIAHLAPSPAAVAEAVKGERERCAKIAEDIGYVGCGYSCQERIADAIRATERPS